MLKNSFLKIAFTLLICGLAFTQLSAQEGLYGRFNVGYSFGINTNPGFYANQTANATGITNLEAVAFDPGSGLNFDLAGGFFLTEGIGIELGVGYLLGTGIETETTSPLGTETTTITGSSISITPALVIQGDEGSIQPYGRVGLIVGINRLEVEESSDALNRVEEYSGGIALGLNSAVGLNFSLGNDLSLFGEFDVNAISYSPTTSEYTTWEVNGADQLSDVTTSQKEFEYVDSYDPSLTPDLGNPTESLAQSYSFSSWGINLGVRMNF